MVSPVMRITQRKERNEAHVVVGERNCPRHGSEHAIHSTVVLERGHFRLSCLQGAAVRSGTRATNLSGERTAGESFGADASRDRRREPAAREGAKPPLGKTGAQFP